MRLDTLKIPVLFHNGKGYDFYPIVKELNEAQCSRVMIIPDNTEKYKMVAINGYKFIDSLSFLQNSIAGLTDNLVGKKCDLSQAPRFVNKITDRLSEDGCHETYP